MIVLNRKQQRRPFGGHHFRDLGVTVRGDSFEELEKKVTDLRLRNGHPVGNPKKEILEYYARFFPFMVENGEDEPEVKPEKNYVKWRDWVRYIWFDPPKKLVSRKEASIRWDVCRNCPRNVKKDWPNSEESREFERRLFIIRAAQDMPEFLGFCSCHRFDLGLGVFLSDANKVSNKEKGDTPPANCWVQSDGR